MTAWAFSDVGIWRFSGVLRRDWRFLPLCLGSRAGCLHIPEHDSVEWGLRRDPQASAAGTYMFQIKERQSMKYRRALPQLSLLPLSLALSENRHKG